MVLMPAIGSIYSLSELQNYRYDEIALRSMTIFQFTLSIYVACMVLPQLVSPRRVSVFIQLVNVCLGRASSLTTIVDECIVSRDGPEYFWGMSQLTWQAMCIACMVTIETCHSCTPSVVWQDPNQEDTDSVTDLLDTIDDGEDLERQMDKQLILVKLKEVGTNWFKFA